MHGDSRLLLRAAMHTMLALLLMWICAPALPLDKVLGFGFTPEYLRIAEGIAETGHYQARLAEGVYLDAVYREPLYPFALAWILKHGGDFTLLQAAQRIAMAVALAIWGLFAHRRFGRLAAGLYYLLVASSVLPHFYTTLLYPYAFQFLLIGGGIRLLLAAAERGRTGYAAAAGLALGAACYERAAYMLLPACLAVLLLLFQRRPRFPWPAAAALVLASVAAIAPWLARNARHDVRGMHQRMGYQLGFTYGHLLQDPRTDLEREYRDSVAVFAGTFETYDANDQGTFHFMVHQVRQQGLSYPEADRLVADLLRPVLRSHPGAVIRNVVNNGLFFPSRLAGGELGRFRPYTYGWSPMRFYQRYAQRFVPTVADFLLLALVLTSAWRLRGTEWSFVLLALGTALYTLGVVGGIGTLDPRYRGAADALWYVLAAAQLAHWAGRLRSPTAPDRVPARPAGAC